MLYEGDPGKCDIRHHIITLVENLIYANKFMPQERKPSRKFLTTCVATCPLFKVAHFATCSVNN